MKLPIWSEMIINECNNCKNLKKILGNIEPLKDIFIIVCFSGGLNINDDNCVSCTTTLNYVFEKYGSSTAYILSMEFSK